MTAERRPWGLAFLLLALLGPFFFASYGFATWWTSRLAEVPSVVFAWEKQIPLWPWTIVPYWSVDLFYAISFFLCTSRAELLTHAKRLLAAQLISVGFFLLFPLRFTFERPPMDGVFGDLFAALMQFDKPFNQAPSLHISLLLILWLRYAAHLGRWGRLLLHFWFALIFVSVLTTWQHHFIDLPTGFLAGVVCIVLFPERQGCFQRDGGRFRLAVFYGLGAGFVALVAGGLYQADAAGLWLCWPASSLALVALIYLRGYPGAFAKEGGRMAWPVWIALAPYLAAAFLNSRLWTRREPAPVEVAPGVWLGRLPSRRELEGGGFRSLVDLSAELPVSPGERVYRAVPMLDLIVPEPGQVAAAAQAIAELEPARPTLVFCAVGYSRSAAAVAAWLLASGRCAAAQEAIEKIAAVKKIALGKGHLALLESKASGRVAEKREH